ncbi:hypothetical protein AA103196_1653 [Ameyamaea chiangmaiensis NBRC 103196]|nr:hypothetical protein AA103196_1653 [Ameyamaea chiangmaiensis NBRC 103196]
MRGALDALGSTTARAGQQVVIVTQSMGGYSALAEGYRVNPKLVIACSPYLTLDPDELQLRVEGERYHLDHYLKFWRIEPDYIPQVKLANIDKYSLPPTMIIFDTDNLEDQRLSEMLRNHAIPYFKVALPGVTHFSLSALEADHVITGFIKEHDGRPIDTHYRDDLTLRILRWYRARTQNRASQIRVDEQIFLIDLRNGRNPDFFSSVFDIPDNGSLEPEHVFLLNEDGGILSLVPETRRAAYTHDPFGSGTSFPILFRTTDTALNTPEFYDGAVHAVDPTLIETALVKARATLLEPRESEALYKIPVSTHTLDHFLGAFDFAQRIAAVATSEYFVKAAPVAAPKRKFFGFGRKSRGG